MWGNIGDPRENMYGEFIGYSPKNIALGYKDLQKKIVIMDHFFAIFSKNINVEKNVPNIVA